MKHSFILALLAGLLPVVTANAADVPVPAQPLGKKGACIFSDDFSMPGVSPAWRELWPALTNANGALNISQTKPAHSAVGMVKWGTRI